MTTYFQDDRITSIICHRDICSLNFVPTKLQLRTNHTPHEVPKVYQLQTPRFGRLILTSLQDLPEISPWPLWEAPQWLTKSVAIMPGNLDITCGETKKQSFMHICCLETMAFFTSFMELVALANT